MTPRHTPRGARRRPFREAEAVVVRRFLGELARTDPEAIESTRTRAGADIAGAIRLEVRAQLDAPGVLELVALSRDSGDGRPEPVAKLTTHPRAFAIADDAPESLREPVRLAFGALGFRATPADELG